MSKDFSRSFYNSGKWVKTRKAYFAYQYGLCEKCKRPGEIVHHKKPLTPRNINNVNITLSFDNLELLCRECHEAMHRPMENHAEGLIFVDGKLITKPLKIR